MMRSRRCTSTSCELSRSRSVAFSIRVAARFLVIFRGEENVSVSSGLTKADLFDRGVSQPDRAGVSPR